MERTPTKIDTSTSQLQHYGSDPTLNMPHDTSNSDNLAYITKRVKRRIDILPADSADNDSKMDELKALILESNRQSDAKYQSLTAAISTLITQNTEIQKSVEFMSKKYDEVLAQLNTLEHVNKQYKSQITSLESKLEILERNSKSSSLEIRNIPKSETEKKDSLFGLITSLGNALDLEINRSDIRDVFRMKTKEGSTGGAPKLFMRVNMDPSTGPINVEFTTIAKKDGLVMACRNYNKINKLQPLNTTNINCTGPPRPIYIQDSLTRKAKHLHYLARAFKKTYQYHGCWTSYGKVYLRKYEGAPAIIIDSKEDLAKLK
ncbi:uncharacterized protein [Choristoneura fumiferana]|uniref:uncharacterized protein n=1 Tax=Choristoneura fumiferana TaxID=7141 RepID=UPI003D15440F